MKITKSIRAFLRFCTELFESYGAESVPLSEEVADLLFSMGKIIKDQLENSDSLLKEAITFTTLTTSYERMEIDLK